MSDFSPSDLKYWESLLEPSGMLNEARLLADSVVTPSTASPDECWEVIWNKPLFANTRVANAEGAIDRLRPHMAGAWTDWGLEGGRFIISHQGGNNSRANFNVQGTEMREIDALRIARHRLLAIQGGAKLLRSAVALESNCPFKTFLTMNRKDMVQFVQSAAGRGWGHITALHLLTDFGLAVKPDLQLVRTIRRLGLLPDLRDSAVPNVTDAQRINDAVNALGAQFFGDKFGPRDRRYFDKLLMELSRQNLLDSISRKDQT